jgi:peptide/nickel transport system permease protein
MIGFILKRLLQSLFVLLVMSLLVFLAIFVIGDPVTTLANQDATPEDLRRLTAHFGLDRSLPEQYFRFLTGALTGDLGRSFVHNESALMLVLDRFPATFELALTAFIFAVLLGIPLGLFAGIRPTSATARTVMAGSIFGFSVPNFFQGLVLILIFAVILKWFPAGGRGETATVLGITSSLFTLDGLSHLMLPALNLALFKVALIIRVTRAATRDVIFQDFILFARAKGLGEGRVIAVHLLKNILIPVITVVGMEFGALIAFAVVTETVFAYPGMGKLLIDSISHLDRPVIIAYLLLTVFIFTMINLIVDILYTIVDPRIRLVQVSG